MKYIKYAVLLILFAAPCRAITLSQIQTDCRTLVKDTGTTRQRFSDINLLRWANEAQKDINQQIWPIHGSTQFELTAGATFYVMPANYLHPLRVTRDYYVLHEKSLKELDALSSWQAVSGLPTAYFTSFSSRTLMGFYPFPGDSSSTGTIRMDYIAQVNDLSAGTDQPFNGIVELQPYGYLLSLYCAFSAAMVDGDPDLSQTYIAQYERGLKRMSEDATARPSYNPSLSGAPAR